jgi:hypothetical protein
VPFYVIKKDGVAQWGGEFASEDEALASYIRVMARRRQSFDPAHPLEIEEYSNAIPSDKQ